MKFFVLAIFALSSVALAKEHKSTGRVFSLFNVVQFDNEGCKSTSSLASSGSGNTHRNGTCYTSTECRDKGGSAAGSCAAGFGVCCVFTLEDSGDINENCTYIRNPDFPNVYSDTDNLRFTVNKCENRICFLRLDFETFNIAGPTDTFEDLDNGHECRDTFTITTSTDSRIPTICGSNSGQHIYVDIGNNPSDTATLNFNFDNSVTNSMRQFEVKVSQIPCGYLAPPNGCLQYHTGITGRFSTFNYADSSGHLASQDYSVCIRQEAGYCCVEYYPCSDDDAFTPAMISDPLVAKFDTACFTEDYIGIEASGSLCRVSEQNLHGRYCGNAFSTFDPAYAHDTVCDCTAPFAIEVFTNAHSDVATATSMPNTMLSRGVCLEWKQVRCGNDD